MTTTIVPLLTLAAVAFVFILILAPRRGRAGQAPSPGENSSRAYALVLRDKLDRAPFGPVLAGEVWDRLMQYPVDEGLIHEFHRDYCGHGLIRTETGVKLCEILDGHYGGPPIAEWSSREAFVGFFAEQSDYRCSGWDETCPVFATQDEWNRNNQRLTRAKLRRFVGQPVPSRA